MLDITDRRKAEETLVESEAKFRNLFENMLNGFAYCKVLTNITGKSVIMFTCM